MSEVGIVGAGTAGLHLALFLQAHGLEPTLYAERTADDVRGGRLPNTVVHNHRTRAREREIGANLWDESGVDVEGHWYQVPHDPAWLDFGGYFSRPSVAVDYRVYQPALMELFEGRGGNVEVGTVDLDGLDDLARRHDLLVVCTGRGALRDLFPPIPGRSPFTSPPRLLTGGIYRGIADAGAPHHVVLSLLGSIGEVINAPILTRDGVFEFLLFECVPDGDLEPLATTPYAEDPQAHDRLTLENVRRYAPRVAERVDDRDFGVIDPTSIIQGAILPAVRQSFVQLEDGTYVIALGDAHVQIDPVCGQGANAASLAAFALGETILEGGAFDGAFCRRVDDRRLTGVLAPFEFTNFMLAPQPQLFDVIGPMSENPALADDFTEGFTDPARHLEHFASPEAAAAYAASFHGAAASG